MARNRPRDLEPEPGRGAGGAAAGHPHPAHLEPLGADPALPRDAAGQRPRRRRGPRRRQRLHRRDARRLAAYPRARVLALPANLGFVRGNNAGIAAAPPGNDVLLLNNDIEFLQHGWLQRLRAAAHSAPDVGVVGCRLVLAGRPAPPRRDLHPPRHVWGQQIGALENDIGQYAGPAGGRGDRLRLSPTLKRDVIDAIGGLVGGLRVVLRGHRLLPAGRQGGFRTLSAAL